METVEINVFTFDELTEEAKEKAREWMRQDYDPAWNDEALESITAFCDHFRIALKGYSVGAYAPLDYNAEYFNSHFRGRKLRDFDRQHMPTGYCLDCDLWMTFYDVFKATGDAKRAFDDALEAGFKAWRRDLEWQLSDECIDELLLINEYRFTANGSIWG